MWAQCWLPPVHWAAVLIFVIGVCPQTLLSPPFLPPGSCPSQVFCFQSGTRTVSYFDSQLKESKPLQRYLLTRWDLCYLEKNSQKPEELHTHGRTIGNRLTFDIQGLSPALWLEHVMMPWPNFQLRRPLVARSSVFNSHQEEGNDQGKASVQGGMGSSPVPFQPDAFWADSDFNRRARCLCDVLQVPHPSAQVRNPTQGGVM